MEAILKSTGPEIVPKDYLHQAQNIDLLKQLLFILHQCRLCTKSSIVDSAKLLIKN
jgi:hypothetical protein